MNCLGSSVNWFNRLSRIEKEAGGAYSLLVTGCPRCLLQNDFILYSWPSSLTAMNHFHYTCLSLSHAQVLLRHNAQVTAAIGLVQSTLCLCGSLVLLLSPSVVATCTMLMAAAIMGSCERYSMILAAAYSG